MTLRCVVETRHGSASFVGARLALPPAARRELPSIFSIITIQFNLLRVKLSNCLENPGGRTGARGDRSLTFHHARSNSPAS